MMKILKDFFLVSLILALNFHIKAETDENPWLHQIAMDSGEGTIELSGTSNPPRALFLLFGNHSYEPDSLILERKEQDHWVKIGDNKSIVIGTPLSIGLFQELKAIPWSLPVNLYKQGVSYRFMVKRKGGLNGNPAKDTFWDQIIVVSESALSAGNMASLRSYQLVESGGFGEALPLEVRKINFSPAEIEKQKECLVDPVLDQLKRSPQKEIPWKELESKAFPLDYQKILLSGINDPDPGFAYQNGQWFVTWTGSDGSHALADWNKKMDLWFAPAIRIGNEIIRPAPLSAKTKFFENKHGRFLPMLALEWVYQSKTNKVIKVTQQLFSEVMDGVPQLFVHMTIDDPTNSADIVIGQGKKPWAHYWDGPSLVRTPIPFFTSQSSLVKKNDCLLKDELKSVVIRASAPIQILSSGISESLLEFEAKNGEVFLAIPQIRTENLSTPITKEYYQKVRQKFEEKWDNLLSGGAHAELPSAEWKSTIDSWLTQICSITKVDSDGKAQLSYGAYFYKAYFGIEEGWPAVALAQWGKVEEAKQEAEILLSKENLHKSNYHHQYRNGLSSWYAASIARLNGDKDWLRSISPALITNGYWTIKARKENDAERSPVSKGLLPSHIYGGDISTPAYSIYSSASCLRGLIETSDVIRQAKLTELLPVANDFSKEAADLKNRLTEVMNEVLDKNSSPVFLPLALELNHKPGNHELAYNRLTGDQLGNYWNLFAPMFLHLDVLKYKDPKRPSEWITDYLENRGGLIAGLPRFNSGLDAVYAVGYISELIERSKLDIGNRSKALAALESFMIHASSRNGHTVPEVSGFFPERLDPKAYERVVRESPWSFGIYSYERYLNGFTSVTEPLGAGAGEGLLLVRKSLIDEVKDENGLPNGGVFFLSSVPGDWLKEGRQINLSHFPTAYGSFDLQVKSFISSKRQIHIKYRYSKVLGNDKSGKDLLAWNKLNKIFIRLVPSPEDCMLGRKLEIKSPMVQQDEWTIQLPIKEQGEFEVKF